MVGASALFAVLASVLAYRTEPASAQVASGSTIVVDTAQDSPGTSGDCSLREAILAANTDAPVGGCEAGSSSGADRIRFSLGRGATTIVLDQTLPAVTDAAGLTINGGQHARITVSGNHQVRVLVVKKGAQLTLRRLTIAKGSAPNENSDTTGSGGGIANRGGTIRVVRSTFSGNEAILRGGAISNVLGAGVVRVIAVPPVR